MCIRDRYNDVEISKRTFLEQYVKPFRMALKAKPAMVKMCIRDRQNAGITIGNVVGSNILNIFIILGLTALITNVAIQRSTLFYEIPFMMFVTVVLMICGMTGGKVTFAEGIVLWVLFLSLIHICAVADSMEGDWGMLKKIGDETTYQSQAAFLLNLNGQLLYIGDRGCV